MVLSTEPPLAVSSRTIHEPQLVGQAVLSVLSAVPAGPE